MPKTMPTWTKIQLFQNYLASPCRLNGDVRDSGGAKPFTEGLKTGLPIPPPENGANGEIGKWSVLNLYCSTGRSTDLLILIEPY